MILSKQALISIRGGICMLKALNNAFSRVLRAINIRYLMHVLFVD